MKMMRFDELAKEAVAFLLWLGAVMLNMAAALWFGFQCLKWLHDGYWTHQPPVMAWIGNVCPGACAFVNNPHSWYGAAKLARLLSELPSGVGLALLGVVLGVLSVSVSDHRPRAPRVTRAQRHTSF